MGITYNTIIVYLYNVYVWILSTHWYKVQTTAFVCSGIKYNIRIVTTCQYQAIFFGDVGRWINGEVGI